jgi:hypothetical protein
MPPLQDVEKRDILGKFIRRNLSKESHSDHAITKPDVIDVINDLDIIFEREIPKILASAFKPGVFLTDTSLQDRQALLNLMWEKKINTLG